MKILIKWVLHLFNWDTFKSEKTTENKVTGLLAEKDDERDHIVGVPTAEQIINRPIKYRIPESTIVRNQRNLNSCASFSACDCVETETLNNNPAQHVTLSRLFHYYVARKEVNKTFPKDGGMTIRDSLKTMHQVGNALEYAYPYDVTKVNDVPPWGAWVLTNILKIKEYKRLLNLEQIKLAVSKNKPTNAGITIYRNYYDLNKENNVYVPNKRMSNFGGHAQMVVGYDDEKQLIELKNSWGGQWGKNGYCFMTYEDFEKESSMYQWWVCEI